MVWALCPTITPHHGCFAPRSSTHLWIGVCVSTILTGDVSLLAMSIKKFNSTKSSISQSGLARVRLQGKQPWLVNMWLTSGIVVTLKQDSTFNTGYIFMAWFQFYSGYITTKHNTHVHLLVRRQKPSSTTHTNVWLSIWLTCKYSLSFQINNFSKEFLKALCKIDNG